jgi:hypothetical protein
MRTFYSILANLTEVLVFAAAAGVMILAAGTLL